MGDSQVLGNQEYLILEKEREVGGLCRSKNVNGYIFDYAPHVLFTKSEYVKTLITNLLRDNLIRQERRAYIYIKGTYVKYPFEVNLKGLPESIIKECINGVLNRSKNIPRNFKEWIYTTFGNGIARYYMIPYNEKVWKYDLSRMDVDWISGRVPSPSVEDMKKGAEGKQRKEFGPNAEFFYPKIGGIGALANSLIKFSSRISLNSEVIEIKRKKKRIEIKYKKEGTLRKISSEYVISSIPLPTLIELLKDVPEDVIKAANSLIFNSLICVNIGVRRKAISEKHWVYFPEKKFLFNRISFPKNFSRFTTPKNRSSILVEVTHRKDEIDLEEVKGKVIDGLINAEILKKDDELEVCDVSSFKYAYVIHDLHRRRNLSVIHSFLEENNIFPVGRYGRWEYLNMDKTILSGKHVVEKLESIKKDRTH